MSKYEVSLYHGQEKIANFNLPDCFDEEDALDMVEDMSKRLGKSHAVFLSEETNAAGDCV